MYSTDYTAYKPKPFEVRERHWSQQNFIHSIFSRCWKFIFLLYMFIYFCRLSELSFGHVSSPTQVGFAQSGKCDDEGKKKTVEKYSFLEAIPLLLVHGEWILTWLPHGPCCNSKDEWQKWRAELEVRVIARVGSHWSKDLAGYSEIAENTALI